MEVPQSIAETKRKGMTLVKWLNLWRCLPGETRRKPVEEFRWWEESTMSCSAGDKRVMNDSSDRIDSLVECLPAAGVLGRC